MSIQILDHGRVREIRLARPPVNALDTALCHALSAAVRQLDATVDGVVLSGSERIFSGGMDVPHLLSHGTDRAALLASWTAFFEAAQALANCPVPVVAAIGGHAPAGGCVLALCCDYRVMARSADTARPYTIGLNEVQVGLAAPDGIQRLLRRVVGAHRAERLLISGQLLPAEQAAQIGLVDELVDGELVTARAVAWLQELQQLPRQPMLATRAVARADLRAALAPELIQLERFVDGWYAPDAQAALRGLVARLQKA
ncbi:enoyl-CoA hydratase/isomerase family protein [Xanthomonas vesicatoria]|uniref:Enoyl-CoA hydratase n=2 Tax=Xanthomonas vesicatoria TaxID=56460 RepID=A0AAJ0N4S2_9XANT|nr:enoyl-CoA hydratase/isomerase family protein [Xanthomonas vesicatoria]APO96897.1 enoyl-CoA hydratase [Xanthomonas vesicatoria]KHM96124.1 enoyl-CoA hydratase [Xanthomonas vesicatoria]MCC8623943.1 enoyl-CoA hydratase/isomerase family protein [Xanthomonas vesicatoria]MCC8695644.1 enoyl-CoA hydratase/isomerase family protein [Xanthomonas vesicatoria]MCC8701520.1 enoyl-CoA hydratase/isomerase family protein [Xanthomonas vesicatoria]